MCFLYSAKVVAPIVRKRAARQRRLEQVGRVAGAGRAAGADQRVRLVDEQDDRLRRWPALRRSPSAGAARTRPSCWRRPAAGRRRARAARTSFSDGGTSPRAMRCAKPSTTAVLPTPASPTRIGLFWRRRIRMSTIWRISSSRPTIGSILPLRACSVRSMVNCFSASCLPIAAGAMAPLASPGAAPRRDAVAGALARPRASRAAAWRKLSHRSSTLMLLELARDREQRVAQGRRLQHAHQQVAACAPALSPNSSEP